MIYLQLFWSFVQIGLFSIGGGYACMPLIKTQVVELHPWLTMGEFADLVTIAEMTPGPIALNAATFVGSRVGGVLGSVICTFSCILPSCIIVSFMAYIYRKYKDLSALKNILSCLRPAVAALIGAAALSILLQALFHGASIAIVNINWISAILFILALTALKTKKLGPIPTMFLCGAAYLGVSLLIEQF